MRYVQDSFTGEWSLQPDEPSTNPAFTASSYTAPAASVPAYTPGAALSPELLQYMAQQTPSASGWDGGGITVGGSTIAPVGNIQTSSDGSIYSPGIQGYVSENNAASQQSNITNPDALAHLYGADGSFQQSFKPEDPYAVDPMEIAILAALAAGGGATALGLGGGGMGLGNSALGSLGGLGGVAEAGTVGLGGAGSLGGAAAGGAGGATSVMGGSGGSGLMGPMTESAMGDAFASQFGQYLSPSSIMGPMTQEQLANSFHQQFGQYAVPPVAPPGGPGSTPPATPPGTPPGGPGVTPPNPFASPESLIPGISNSSLLGGAATLLGGAAGAQGTPGTSQNSTRAMDPRMDALFYNDIAPRTQGLLGSSMPQAQGAGDVMMAQGTGLLNRSVAGNGTGQVTLNAPTTSTNPYLSSMADDVQRRTQEMLGQNNRQIQSNYVGSGGMGNTRMGVAQGTAAGKAADYLSGNLSNMFGTAYNADQNRALSQYQGDQSFYTGQRGQDLAQVGVGAGLVNQGLQAPWQPLQNASQTYAPFTGFGSTTNSTPEQSGGWQGAVGGLLTGASLGKSLGWW